MSEPETIGPSPIVLRKPVETLAMVPSSGKITVLARKIWNVLMHLAQEQARRRDDLEEFEAPLSDLVAGMEFNSRNISILREHLAAMNGTTVQWQSPTEGEGFEWGTSGLISEAKVTVQRGQSIVRWAYGPTMRRRLLDPDIFAKLPLAVVAQLRTGPAVSLYESCSRYRAVGQTAKRPWRWWAPVLLGRPDDERMQRLEYRIFKRDTLTPAIAEINAVSDLEVQVVEARKGRYVDTLQFMIKVKDRPREMPPVDLGLLARGVAAGVERSRFERLLEEYGQEALEKAVPVLERRLENAYPEPVRSAHVYLKALLTNGATGAGEGVAKPQPPVQAAQIPTPRLAADNRRTRWITERMQRFSEELDQLPAERLTELEQRLVQSDVHSSVKARVRERGWRHQLVRPYIVRLYAVEEYGLTWNEPTEADLSQV